jgi:hypothetical protein
MKFRHWLAQWLVKDDHRETVYSNKISASTDREEYGTPIRFSVTPARGGIVVTSRTYDRQKDRSDEIIHVIHDDEDVARKVGDIVAMELMKS